MGKQIIGILLFLVTTQVFSLDCEYHLEPSFRQKLKNHRFFYEDGTEVGKLRLRTNENQIWVYNTDDEVLGFLDYKIEGDDLLVSMLAVNQVQRQGLSKLMIEEVVRANNIKTMSGIMSADNHKIFMDSYLANHSIRSAIKETPAYKIRKSLGFMLDMERTHVIYNQEGLPSTVVLHMFRL